MSKENAVIPHDVMVAEKRRVAITSVIAAICLTGMKLGVGLWTDSLGILSEALHSGLDLLAATITYFAVRVADRPPDDDHQYGHGKIENLSALFETMLLLVTCVWILFEAWERLSGEAVDIEVNVWAFAVIIISIVVDFSRSRALMKVARKYNSQALEADALHFRTDIYSSAVVFVGLVSVTIGFPEADAIAAAMVAIIVIWIGIRLGRQTIDGLLDRVPEGVQSRLEEVVQETDGVESLRGLRIRPSGGAMFINLIIGIQRTTFFDRAHAIVDNVEDAVRVAFPRSDVLVHAEPVIGVRETLSDKIEWLVRQSGLTAHNIQILWVDDQFHVDFDIEFSQGSSFIEAHDMASEVEARIHENIPGVAKVHIHLEEERLFALSGIDVSEREHELLQRLRESILLQPDIHRVCELSCYETEDGMRMSLTVQLTRELPLGNMHERVDHLEILIKAADERVGKVFIHAEPSES